MRDHLWHRREMSGKLADIRQSAKGKALYPVGAPIAASPKRPFSAALWAENVAFGSSFPVASQPEKRLVSGGKQSKAPGKLTLGLEGRLAAGKQPCSRAAVEAC